MLEAHRPKGRFFYGLVVVLMGWSLIQACPLLAADTPPATTHVSDTVYRADGKPGSGTVLISWPAFTTSDSKPVAAGTLSVTVGPDGAFAADLVPNVGATPADSYYSVVFQLDTVVRTEYWLVGTTSPTTISAVRATPGSGTATPAASKQYVDNAIAINKAYVDTAVAAVGSGSYVAKNGDAMSGPLTLPSDPVAPSQAATKHYVDSGLLAKANLVGGVVPPAQLGTGNSDGTTCLKGDSTWSPCGSGGGSGVSGSPSAGMQVVGNGSAFVSQSKPALDVRDYGAKGDGQVATDCYMSAGSALLKCESNHFVAGDVGKKIAVYGSGPTLNGFIQPLSSTIASYQSATQVTLANAAGNSTTHSIAAITTCSRSGNVTTCNTAAAHGFQAGQMVKIGVVGSDASFAGVWPIQTVPSGTSFTINSVLLNDVASSSGGTADGHSERVVWGTDDSTALQAAVDACGSAGGCKIIVPKGLYLLHGVSMPCSTVGNYSSLGGLNCTIAYNNITLAGDGAETTIWENWDTGTNVNALNTGGWQGLISMGRSVLGDFDAPIAGWPNYNQRNIEIYGFTFRQIKNASVSLFDIMDWASTNVKIHHNAFVDYPRECLVEGGKSSNWDVHDNTFYQCGLGGPTYVTTGAGLNLNGSFSQVHDNFVSDSGQAFEGAAHDSEVYANTFDGGGPDVTPGSGPHEWMNLTSGTYGIWNWQIRDNRIRGWNGAAIENVNGVMANVAVDNNSFVDAIGGVSIGSGKEANNVAYGPQPVKPHGVSSFSGNKFTYTGAQYPTTYAFSVNGNQSPLLEDLVIDRNLVTYKTGFCGQGSGRHNACLKDSDCDAGLQCTVPVGVFAITAPGLGPTWTASTAYGAGKVAVPTAENSYIYINNGTGGTSGAAEPAWCTTPSCTVTDGSVTWTLYGKRPRATFSNTTVTAPPGVAPYGNEISIAATPAAAFSVNGFNYNLATRMTQPGLATVFPANQTIYQSGLTANTFTSTVPTGTAPFSVTSTTNVPNLNASLLNGGTFAAPGPIGSTTPSTGAFTNLTVTGTCTGCGSGSSPLTTKGDLYTFGSTNTRLGAGADGLCLVTDSTQALGLKWGSCAGESSVASVFGRTGVITAQNGDYTVSQITNAAADSAVVHNSGTETIGGDKTFSGNITVQGAMTVAGPWQVESTAPATPMTAGAGDSKIGFDLDGKLKVSENGGAVTEVAKVSQIPAAPVNSDWNASGGLAQILNKPTIPAASSSTPAMNGSGAAGASANYAREDHVHPTDSSRAKIQSCSNKVLGAVDAAGTAGNCVQVTSAMVDNSIATSPGIWITTLNTGNIGTAYPSVANKMMLWGVVNPLPVTTSSVTYSPGTADNTANIYDLCFYDSSGALKVHTGATPGTTFAPTTGPKILNWITPATLAPGRYYLATTSNCSASCATLTSPGANGVVFYKAEAALAMSIASGGTCPNSITPPADSPSWAAYTPALIVK